MTEYVFEAYDKHYHYCVTVKTGPYKTSIQNVQDRAQNCLVALKPRTLTQPLHLYRIKINGQCKALNTNMNKYIHCQSVVDDILRYLFVDHIMYMIIPRDMMDS